MDLTKDTLPTPASRRPLIPVETAWGGTLYARTLSAAEANGLPEDENNFTAQLILRAVVFADGTPVWTEEAEVLAYPVADLTPLLVAAAKANGLGNKSVEQAKGN
jgi:hypothetical protein